MKELFKMFGLALFLLAGLSACEKDDDLEVGNGDEIENIEEVETSENVLKIGTTEFEIAVGLLENYGLGEEGGWYSGYKTDLVFISSDLSFGVDGEGDWYVDGEGHALNMEMFSTAANALDAIDYEFSGMEPHSTGTFIGEFVLNYNAEKDEADLEGEMGSGTIRVEKTGESYSITILGKSKDGKNISGYYEGSLQYFDYSDEM